MLGGASNRCFHMTLYARPQPAGSKVSGITREGRRYYRDANPKAADWKRTVGHRAGEIMRGSELLDGPLILRLTFWLPRPKGHFGTKGLRSSARKYPTSDPDLTKLTRGTEDALKGIVWRDDAQVVTQVVTKRYGEPAGVEITVSRQV